MAENEHKTERVPEKASRSMLDVPIGPKRNQLDIEKDTWYAVAELAKGKTYREIAQELHCSVHSFAPRVEVLELVAHLTISTFSLSDIITDCLPSAKPSSIPPISREIV